MKSGRFLLIGFVVVALAVGFATISDFDKLIDSSPEEIGQGGSIQTKLATPDESEALASPTSESIVSVEISDGIGVGMN